MPYKKKNNQNGGRVTMPSEYFGKNSGRYFAEGSPVLNIANSAYGANRATSRGVLIGQNLSGPDLGPTSHSGVQTGGRYVDNSLNRRLGRVGKKYNKNNKRNNNKNNNQNGGRVTMPSEYFGKNSSRYFAEGSPALNIANSAYGANRATSRGVLIGQNLSGPDLGPTSHSGVQTGGAFNFIVNPSTGRKVRVNGKLGQKVLKNYINELYN